MGLSAIDFHVGLKQRRFFNPLANASEPQPNLYINDTQPVRLIFWNDTDPNAPVAVDMTTTGASLSLGKADGTPLAAQSVWTDSDPVNHNVKSGSLALTSDALIALLGATTGNSVSLTLEVKIFEPGVDPDTICQLSVPVWKTNSASMPTPTQSPSIAAGPQGMPGAQGFPGSAAAKGDTGSVGPQGTPGIGMPENPLALIHGGTGATDANGARTALGLGGASVLAVGTVANTVAAGDDPRFNNATKLQGNSVANTAPADGQVLKWNATLNKWAPANL